jgi:hypothetical protein
MRTGLRPPRSSCAETSVRSFAAEAPPVRPTATEHIVAIVEVALVCLAVSAVALCVVIWFDALEDLLHPGVAAVVLIVAVALALPAHALYERTPFVPKPRQLRLRCAARRLQKNVAGTVGFHLPSFAGEVTDVALIVRRDDELSRFADRDEELASLYRDELLKQALVPSPLARSPRVLVVSKEQIRRGGGPFHFWRETGLF